MVPDTNGKKNETSPVFCRIIKLKLFTKKETGVSGNGITERSEHK